MSMTQARLHVRAALAYVRAELSAAQIAKAVRASYGVGETEANAKDVNVLRVTLAQLEEANTTINGGSNG